MPINNDVMMIFEYARKFQPYYYSRELTVNFYFKDPTKNDLIVMYANTPPFLIPNNFLIHITNCCLYQDKVEGLSEKAREHIAKTDQSPSKDLIEAWRKNNIEIQVRKDVEPGLYNLLQMSKPKTIDVFGYSHPYCWDIDIYSNAKDVDYPSMRILISDLNDRFLGLEQDPYFKDIVKTPQENMKISMGLILKNCELDECECKDMEQPPNEVDKSIPGFSDCQIKYSAELILSTGFNRHSKYEEKYREICEDLKRMAKILYYNPEKPIIKDIEDLHKKGYNGSELPGLDGQLFK